jgi:hypothetical protein
MANAYAMAAAKALLSAGEAALKDLEDLDAPEVCSSLRTLREAVGRANGWAAMRGTLCACDARRIGAMSMSGKVCPCGIGVPHRHCPSCKGVCELGA